MNVQYLNVSCLRVCMQALCCGGRLFSGYTGVLMVLILVSAAGAVSAYAEEYDIIIEKNLFHDQRQKWEMVKSQSKGAASQAGPQDRQNIDQINLFGTVIKDSHAYAVMRVTPVAAPRRVTRRTRRGKPGKSVSPGGEQSSENKRPYAVGDFISGYQLVEIRPESVLLQDPYDNKRYEIFMNDGQTERTEVRTEIAEDKPEEPPQAPAKDKKAPRSSQARSAPPPNQAASADIIRQRFEKDLQRRRDEKNDESPQQAERDGDTLPPGMPALDEKGQEELMRLKSEFEKLQQ